MEKKGSAQEGIRILTWHALKKQAESEFAMCELTNNFSYTYATIQSGDRLKVQCAKSKWENYCVRIL